MLPPNNTHYCVFALCSDKLLNPLTLDGRQYDHDISSDYITMLRFVSLRGRGEQIKSESFIQTLVETFCEIF